MIIRKRLLRAGELGRAGGKEWSHAATTFASMTLSVSFLLRAPQFTHFPHFSSTLHITMNAR